MDRWTDGWKNNVALAHPYQVGSHVVSLVKLCPVGGDGQSEEQRYSQYPHHFFKKCGDKHA